MYLYSKLPKDQYLAAMRRKFTNPLLIFDRRITGFTLGSFFAVAHYQNYEWNRRITGECNRAWGFVKEVDGELEICFLRGKGTLTPTWLLVQTLLCEGIFLFVQVRNGVDLGIYSWLLAFGCALISSLASAFGSSVTEAGQQGVREVNKFLVDPENYYC